MPDQLTKDEPSDSATVLLIDRDCSVRRSVSRLLESAGLTVETLASADELLSRDPLHGPGCVVLDLRMPGTSGLQVQRKLALREVRLPIIFTTGHGTVSECAQAMKAGAVDFLEKPIADEDLLCAVRRAVDLSRAEGVERARRKATSARLARLTRRERQVLSSVMAGMLNKQIAVQLGISEKTVKTHRIHMMAKMHVHSVAELALLVRQVDVPTHEVDN